MYVYVYIYRCYVGSTWAQGSTFPGASLFITSLRGGMGHAPQDFAMLEPNDTCVLTIQLHFDF